jgi:hypothetical protein
MLEPSKNIYLYNLENVEDFPELNGCKELGKKWAELMEERLENKKVIVLLNEYKKTVKLTFTFQILSEKFHNALHYEVVWF